MKLSVVLIGLMMLFTSIAFPATVNGRFTVIQIDSLKLTVLFQMNTNTGTDDLGGATIVFSFDTIAVNFPTSPVNNVDYVFHNFNNGNYSPASITRPMRNKIWVNIDLPFSNNNNGTIVSQNPAWTDVVTIYFDIINPNGSASLTWSTTSPFWGIYDADNSTLWQTGQFENLFGPLPVELISFTGTIFQNENVLLEWKTASSSNNAGFEVQKSYKNVEAWEAIGFVPNQGDPSSLVEYSFTDITKHISPVVRYRLKSIDNDGSFQYSYILEVNTSPLSYNLSQNYPNPFNPSTKITFSIPFTGSGEAVYVRLNVYDILGNTVAVLVNEEKVAGSYEIEFNSRNGISDLSSGIYIYRIEINDRSSSSDHSFIDSKKMVLLR